MSVPAPTAACAHALLARTAALCSVMTVWLCAPEAAHASYAVLTRWLLHDLGRMVNRRHDALRSHICRCLKRTGSLP